MGRLLPRSLWDSRIPPAIPHHDERQSREYPHPSASARPSRLGDWPRSGADGGISTLSRCHAGPTPAKMRFSCDSPLEGDGFELSVPGRETVKPSWETGLLSRKRERICWGTEGSNPSPSSGESAANSLRSSTDFRKASRSPALAAISGTSRDQAGEIIGAVGISGDISENDETCAVYGIECAGLTADTG